MLEMSFPNPALYTNTSTSTNNNTAMPLQHQVLFWVGRRHCQLYRDLLAAIARREALRWGLSTEITLMIVDLVHQSRDRHHHTDVVLLRPDQTLVDGCFTVPPTFPPPRVQRPSQLERGGPPKADGSCQTSDGAVFCWCNGK